MPVALTDSRHFCGTAIKYNFLELICPFGGKLNKLTYSPSTAEPTESARFPRFQFVEHPPDSVSFAALHNLQGSRAIKSRIRLFKPRPNPLASDKFFQFIKQSAEFCQSSFGRCAGLSPLRPMSDGTGRKSGQASECILIDPIGIAKFLYIKPAQPPGCLYGVQEPVSLGLGYVMPACSIEGHGPG
jgi:hypothetical protein